MSASFTIASAWSSYSHGRGTRSAVAGWVGAKSGGRAQATVAVDGGSGSAAHLLDGELLAELRTDQLELVAGDVAEVLPLLVHVQQPERLLQIRDLAGAVLVGLPQLAILWCNGMVYGECLAATKYQGVRCGVYAARSVAALARGGGVQTAA